MSTVMASIASLVAAVGALVLLATTPVLGQDTSPAGSLASSTLGSEAWGQVPFEAGLRDPYGASHIKAVASGPRGIVAVGMSPTGAAAWHSVDGLTWERAIPPRSWTTAGRHDQYPSLEDVVATDDGFVVVGTERDGPKGDHGNIGSVWTSQDGLDWRRTARGVGPYLIHVIEHDGRVYAVSGRVAGRTPGAIWVSEDASEWEQVHVAPEDESIDVIASDDDVLVAGSHRAMARSRDGHTWFDAPIEEGGSFDIWLEDATAFDGGFLAVGSRDGDGAAWRSRDGRAWEAVPETVDTGAYITHFNAVAPLPDGGVLVTAGTDEYEGLLYRSEDGESWGEPVLHVASDDDGGDWPFEDVVVPGDAALVVGQQPDGPHPFSAAAWTAPPPADLARPSSAVTACPGQRPTIGDLVVMDPAARLDCFGDRELTFRAWLAPHQYPDLEYFSLPHWLTAGVGGRRALPVEGSPSATMSLTLHGRPRDRGRLDKTKGRWAIVSGHFDDPGARECTRRWRTVCRQAFVVGTIRPGRDS